MNKPAIVTRYTRPPLNEDGTERKGFVRDSSPVEISLVEKQILAVLDATRIPVDYITGEHIYRPASRVIEWLSISDRLGNGISKDLDFRISCGQYGEAQQIWIDGVGRAGLDHDEKHVHVATIKLFNKEHAQAITHVLTDAFEVGSYQDHLDPVLGGEPIKPYSGEAIYPMDGKFEQWNKVRMSLVRAIFDHSNELDFYKATMDYQGYTGVFDVTQSLEFDKLIRAAFEGYTAATDGGFDGLMVANVNPGVSFIDRFVKECMSGDGPTALKTNWLDHCKNMKIKFQSMPESEFTPTNQAPFIQGN